MTSFHGTIETQILTTGKIYEITYSFAGSIIVKCDYSSKYFSALEGDKMAIHAEYKLNEYFITLIEARKKKLEDLSDENFSMFLKKIKKIA